MRRFCWAVLVVVLIAAGQAKCVERECSYPSGSTGTSGRDEASYFIRVTPYIHANGEREASEVSLRELGEYLAHQAGVDILYFLGRTERKLFEGEWRGSTPLEALQAFAAAGGVRLEVPQPNLWVIGPPEYFDSAALTVTIMPADPERQGALWGAQTQAAENELIRLLAVRDSSSYGRLQIEVEYYWLAEEGPGSLIVQVRHVRGSHQQNSRVHKLRFRRESGELSIECEWSTWLDVDRDGVTHIFSPEIAEDVDGDGVRDLFFFGIGDRTFDTLLSGRDGRELLTAFATNELAVEKRESGAKRIAVDDPRGPDYIEGPTAEEAPWKPGAVVMQYDGARQKFVAYERSEIVARSMSPAGQERPQKVSPRDLLAAVAGGPEKVRVYLNRWVRASDGTARGDVVYAPNRQTRIQFGSKPLSDGVPQPVSLDAPYFKVTPGYEERGRLFTPRVVFDYKSPGYLKKLQEAEERQKSPPTP
jgi:hypothetical protein